MIHQRRDVSPTAASLIDLSAPLRPAARRGRGSRGVIVAGAVAVFMAGGVGYAVLRPAPVVAPVVPPAAVLRSPDPVVGPVEIPEAAVDPIRRSPAAR